LSDAPVWEAHWLFYKMSLYKEVFMSIGDQINALINKGGEEYEKENYTAAVESFEKALKIANDNFPNDPKIQDLNELVEMANNAKKSAEQRDDVLANEARQWAETLRMKVEDTDMAILGGEEMIKNSPNDASIKTALAMAYYIRGLIFMSKKEYARAIADYSNAIKYEPDSILEFQKNGKVDLDKNSGKYVGVLALKKRSQAYLDNSDFDKAIADFKQLIRFDPRYNNSLAGAYMNRGPQLCGCIL